MKKLSLLLTGTLLFTACSKTVKQVHHEQKTQPLAVLANNDIEMLRNLMKSSTPNLALADLLARSIGTDHQEEFKAILAELSPEDAQKIIKEVEQQNQKIRSEFLYHGQTYQEHDEFLAKITKNDLAINMPSVTDQLKISAFGYVKNKVLDEIIETYEKRAIELSLDLSMQIAVGIANDNPALAKRIEAAQDEKKIFELIKNSKETVDKIDLLFRASDLNEKEQYTLLATGLVAGGIYTQLAKHKDFQHLVQEAKNVIADVKAIKAKADEAIVLVGTLDKHISETKKNAKNFKDGLEGIHKDMREAYDKNINAQTVDSKKVLNFLHEKLLKNKEPDTQLKEVSVLSGKINQNILKTVDSVSGMAVNLNNILQTTNQLMGVFGVKASPSTQKLLEKAAKVAKVAVAVQGAMVGFATGGPMGAMASVAGSMGMFGGSGGGDSAKLAEISKKLDEVIAMQKQMLQMQMETMKLIKELAVMIDAYHQVQMAALSELRDEALIGKEMLQAMMNLPISSCETMIKAQMDFKQTGYTTTIAGIQNIKALSINRNKFNENIKSFARFAQIADGNREDAYRDCQNGLSMAFDGKSINENPIRAIFAGQGDDNLKKFERDTYQPLLQALQSFANTTNFESVPLHLPTVSVKDLKLKEDYLNYNAETREDEIYEIETLISVKALERYTTSLLMLHPIMEFDKDEWSTSVETIVNSFLDKPDHETRGLVKLKNALKLTQSAIAQEAILSGEPILHKMHGLVKELLSKKTCTDENCKIRGNKLFMKNFVMYALNVQNENSPGFMAAYEQAYKVADLKTLATLLNTDFTAQNLAVVKVGEVSDVVINLSAWSNHAVGSVQIKLPTPEALKEGKILYSENMPRLLLMQSLIIDELEKVVPLDRDQDLIKVMMLANQGV